MSGPVTPPLEVTEVDGSPDGRPITKIVVSNGDLTISGRTATIDTSGSGGTPAGSDREIQFNDAGAFGASSQFIYQTGASLGRLEMTTGTPSIAAEIRAMVGHGLQIGSSAVTASALKSYISFFGENETPVGMRIISSEAGGTIAIQTTGSGSTEIGNETTDQDSTLNVVGNGAGTPILNLKNDTKEVRLTCETDDQLYVRGPTSGERFTFDASGANTGITWPDGTTQITAASGGSAYSPILPNTAIEAASASDMYCLNGYAPYGNGNNSSTTMWGNTNGNRMFLYPFVAPATLTITNLEIYIAIAAGSACNGLCAFFTDSNGVPSTLMGKTSVDVTSTGAKVMTAFLDSAGASTTVSLTAGTQYWFCFGRDTTDVSFAFYGTNSYSRVMVCMVGAANFTANGQNVLRTVAETVAVPASFTATNLEPYGSVFAMTALIN